MANVTVFGFDTTFGTIPMIDGFHVVDGQILSIRAYNDSHQFRSHLVNFKVADNSGIGSDKGVWRYQSWNPLEPPTLNARPNKHVGKVFQNGDTLGVGEGL